jgi:hypothetical protein
VSKSGEQAYVRSEEVVEGSIREAEVGHRNRAEITRALSQGAKKHGNP